MVDPPRVVLGGVFEYVEGFYNPRRRRSTLGRLSPVEFEGQHAGVTRGRAQNANPCGNLLEFPTSTTTTTTSTTALDESAEVSGEAGEGSSLLVGDGFWPLGAQAVAGGDGFCVSALSLDRAPAERTARLQHNTQGAGRCHIAALAAPIEPRSRADPRIAYGPLATVKVQVDVYVPA
jgi:hypothetical protein